MQGRISPILVYNMAFGVDTFWPYRKFTQQKKYQSKDYEKSAL